MFDTDPANDKGGTSAEAKEPGAPPSESQRKSNSWFRMQASSNSEADIFIYDEIGYWGVTAKQFVNDPGHLGTSPTSTFISTRPVVMSSTVLLSITR